MGMFEMKRCKKTENVSICSVTPVEGTGTDTPGNTNEYNCNAHAYIK